MARWARHFVGIGIIVAGFCAASQFRIDPPGDGVPAAGRDFQRTHLRSTEITLQIAPSAAAPVASSEKAALSAETPQQDQPTGSRSSLAGTPSPPRLAPDYQWLVENAAVSSTTIAAISPEGGSAPRRTHTIRDGDSLEEIASRYLGDADRWQELLDANADVLTSRDLLPVNTVIEIPPRRFDDRNPASYTVEREGDDDLVPVRNR